MGIAEFSFRTKSRAMSPSSYRAWQRLAEHDTWTPEAIAELNKARSLEIARFAYERSSFYWDFYESNGISATDLRDPEVFTSLPFLTKDLIRENFDGIKTSDATERNASKSISSGSTGHPLTVLSDRRAPVRAYEWRAMGWWGVNPWDSGTTIDRSWRSGLRKAQHALFWWPVKRSLFHTLKLDETTLDAFLEQWQKQKPQFRRQDNPLTLWLILKLICLRKPQRLKSRTISRS